MVGVGQRFGCLLAYLSANGVVQEEVKLNGKVCLDGVSAVACVEEG